MGTDALIALVIGRVYDRKGLISLISAPLFCLPIPFLVFLGNYRLAVVGLLFWGMAMGVNETIMRAAIADIVPVQSRGSAYGIFNTVFGFAWFAGSGIMGILYGISFGYLIAFCIIMEAMSLLILPSILTKVKQRVV